ncbi:hypothetical protein DAMA08_035270 [Martiniozyma asiatica (nom. inval.)]|nr:hypothetical protein DAMA08_035270 [Martiniozyma asiatica]
MLRARALDVVAHIGQQLETYSLLENSIDWSEIETLRNDIPSSAIDSEIISKFNSMLHQYNPPKTLYLSQRTNSYSDSSFDNQKVLTHYNDNDDTNNFANNMYKDNDTIVGSDKKSYVDTDFNTDIDNDEEYLDPNSLLNDAELFIQNTQLVDQQDEQLRELHGSVRNQHHMANQINDHLNHDSIILRDLEAQMDNTRDRVNLANSRIMTFNNQSSKWLIKEWCTVLFLLIILILLLKW